MSSEAYPDRKYLPHDTPGWVEPGAEFFVTGGCARRGVTTLTNPAVARGLFEAIGRYHRARRWYVYRFLLMPDHWHAILAFPDNALRRQLADWKRFTARTYHIAWQRDFFDHRLRDGDEHSEKSAYIRNNPVRRGLVVRAEDWPYSWTTSDFASESTASRDENDGRR